MSKSSVRIQGAVNELITNALEFTKRIQPGQVSCVMTVNLKDVLRGMTVTPSHRGEFQSILKHRAGCQCTVSSIIKDNYHVTILVHQVCLDQAQFRLYEEYFGTRPAQGRLITYLPQVV